MQAATTGQPPRPSVARAVVLYGRVGTYAVRTASLKKGMPGDVELWRNCAETISTHVVKPWLASGTVDVFVQSWNPEMASDMNAHWKPRSFDHAEQNYSLGRSRVKLNYSDRTMWALLGMKKALALRSAWVSRQPHATPHATVLVMRHDVYWIQPLPPLRADKTVRLWLPFDCHRSSGCRDRGARAADFYVGTSGSSSSTAPGASPQPREKCDDKSAANGEWSTLSPHRSVLGTKCYSGPVGSRSYTFCSNSVNIDWWWAGDSALADRFGETFDNFDHYSKLVRELLRFHNSAPHHYWGLFFFHTNQLRDKCQVGHAAISGLDFTLGRFVKDKKHVDSPVCRFQGWRAYWRPPTTHATGYKGATSHATCNASAIAGYLTMCPGTPSHALHRVCGEGPMAENATKYWHKHRERPALASGNIPGNGSFGLRSRDRRRGPRLDHPSTTNRTKPGKTVRERLLELASLKNEKLISATEYETLRARVLELLVATTANANTDRPVGTSP